MKARWKLKNIASRVQQPKSTGIYLTGREPEILRLLSQGKTDRDIAQALGLSRKTVNHHVKALLTKLEVRNRTHAVVQGLRLRIIDLE